ncbi:MAG: exodeoxyribonuclease VII small subunit [Phycicoccus sp.]
MNQNGLSYELVEVVRRLESGGTSLEESLALWELGETRAARCQAWLDGAQAPLAAATEEKRAGTL